MRRRGRRRQRWRPRAGRRRRRRGTRPGRRPGRGPSSTGRTGRRRSASSSPSTGHLDRRGAGRGAAARASTWRRTRAPKSPGSSGSDHVGRQPAPPARTPCRLWWESPGAARAASASDTRSAATGRPPRVAAALTASPAATPEKPHRVPVPRLPGPWVTTATSAPQRRAGRRAARCARSPPRGRRRTPGPTVTRRRPASPASRSPATRAREPRRQRPAVGHHVGDPRLRPARARSPASTAGSGGVQVGDDDRHPAQVVRVAQRRRGAASPARRRPAPSPAAGCSAP